MLNKEKEVIFESDDVTEVIDKAKELFGQCERNMINNHIKSGLNFEHFIAKIEIVRLDNMGDFCINQYKEFEKIGSCISIRRRIISCYKKQFVKKKK
mgnify:CR=1 FL=1